MLLLSMLPLHHIAAVRPFSVPPSLAAPPPPVSLPRAASPAAGRLWLLSTLALALLFLAWEAAGGDRWFASLAGNAAGFPWRNHWLLDDVLHGIGRLVAWAIALALCLGVWWPVGPLRLLSLAQRLQLAGGVLLSVALVALLKSVNPAACPWSLAAYGGLAQPVSHWAWWSMPPGGRGGCFPAGHASAGFAFIGGYFAFRPVAPALARRWLAAALAAGLLLGLSQQWRGAHFMSHTLWSGWLCWCLAWSLDSLRQRLERAPQPLVAAQ
jgi:membrane-associated PAP2 superfamily phosphatase